MEVEGVEVGILGIVEVEAEEQHHGNSKIMVEVVAIILGLLLDPSEEVAVVIQDGLQAHQVIVDG